MEICISSKYIGTAKHLLWDEGEFRWVSHVPKTSWSLGFGNTHLDIKSLSSRYNIEIPSIASEPQFNAFKEIGVCHAGNIPWRYVLGEKDYRLKIDELLSALRMLIQALEEDSYGNICMNKRIVLDGLSRALIDIPRLRSYVKNESNQTLKSTLKSFCPEGEFARPSLYNLDSTLTGRMTISSGPQILTLAKKYRDILKSRYPSGKIVQVDFVSLEPRVAMKIAGHESDKDVYEIVNHQMFSSSLSRGQVKLAVLCALYGASVHRLTKTIGNAFPVQKKIRQIKDYFGVKAILSSARKCAQSEKPFCNYFGRELQLKSAQTNTIVSHFIQSTGVDVAMMGFYDIIQRIQDAKLNALPIYVIHDALLLDVDPGSLEELREISKSASVEGLGKFPLDITVVS